jgi:dihydrofolate reductase
MIVSLIVAFDNHLGIGKNNKLLWHLPNDLKYFKALTTGRTIIMGRNTYESIGRPLPNRTNVVVSRNVNYNAEGCTVVHSLEAAITFAQHNNDDEVIIIGGAQLYNQAIGICSKLYVTRVNCALDADTRFPQIDPNKWKLIIKEPRTADEKHAYDYCFETYVKP